MSGTLAPRVGLYACGLAAAGVLAIGALYAGLESTATVRASGTRLEAQARAAARAIARSPTDAPLVEGALAVLGSNPDVRRAELRDSHGRTTQAGPTPAVTAAPAVAPAPEWLRPYLTTTVDLPVTAAGAGAEMLHVEGDFSATFAAALERCGAFVLACGLIAAALTALMLAFLARRVRRPLLGMAGAVRSLNERGEFGGRIEPLAADELGALAGEINALLDAFQARDLSLRAYTTEFERRVRERTQELDTAVAQARDATRRAQEATRAKGDFLAHISHEIRTPLNGVLGMAELLQHSPTLDERQRRYAVVIHQSGTALLSLINDVLDFSKIEAGKLELARERFCLRDMVEDALEILAERAQSKGLELICDVPVDIDTIVHADSLRLRQVILNLVGNAVKFTERGDITVSLRTEPGIEHSQCTFEVTDTGIGIAADACATIFDAFVQGDNSTSRRYGGTGLGLAICRQLVELMGGTIAVRSTPGTGSTFRFTVPLAVDRTAEREKPPAILPTTRVLIVEKSAAVRRMLGQHLRSWGAIPTELGTATEALRRLGSGLSGEFELLILDAHLPDGGAAPTVAAIRRMAAFAEIPILVMHTGSGDPPPEARGMQGPVAWQNKPIRRSQLQHTLERLLGKSPAPAVEARVRPAAAAMRTVAAASTGEPASPAARVRHILLVEDNAVNREVARAMLQSLEVAIDSAASGKEALEKLTAKTYDAVLMDCQLPDLDGYETTERWRQWEREHGRPRTPVIAVTANALSGDADRCRAAGMDHYVSKPFTIEELHAALAFCAHRGSAAEARATPAVGASAATPPAPSAPLDARTVERLRTLGAGARPGLLARLAEIYESSSEDLVNTLHAAAGADDARALGRAAHALKSSSANVGATALAATCQELEAAVRDGHTELARSLVPRLQAEHREVLKALRARRAATSQPPGQSAPRGEAEVAGSAATG